MKDIRRKEKAQVKAEAAAVLPEPAAAAAAAAADVASPAKAGDKDPQCVIGNHPLKLKQLITVRITENTVSSWFSLRAVLVIFTCGQDSSGEKFMCPCCVKALTNSSTIGTYAVLM